MVGEGGVRENEEVVRRPCRSKSVWLKSSEDQVQVTIQKKFTKQMRQ